ncbi:MAG: hypothetical protein ABI833_00660 [Acidobacteriota bacterium]
MATRLWIVIVIGAACLSAQSPKTAKFVPSRTAFGQPDLQGVWTNATLTPLERPAALASKAFFTPAEAGAFEKQAQESNNRDRRGTDATSDLAGAYNQAWFDRGTKVVSTLRTSLIVDPDDGKIPYTADGRKRLSAAADFARAHPADGPEDLALADRCLLWATAGPPMLPGPYNSNYQIFQTPEYVAILVEMIHDVRIIPLDGRPHLASGMREWLGDSRGHWEGNTLVVETTNFTYKSHFRGATENMRLIERFTRTDADTLTYDFTVEDPATFLKPWSASIPMTKSPGPIYEYACHEGNYAIPGILGGARAQEAAAKGGK